MTAAELHTSPRARRPRRIAADEAHAWARNLRLGNPFAKLVLSMLTIYVNGEGSCFVSISQLAEDCELAENTVRRRLAFLEQIGAIAKFPQWQDEHGRRNSEGRGKRTTDDIRLLLNDDQHEIEARAAGNVQVAETDDTSEDSGDSGVHPVNPSNPVSPSLGVHQPSHCGQGLNSSNHEPEENPPYPPSGGEPQWPHGDSWKRFEDAYPEPILRQSIARNVWSALTDTERELATRAAEGYALHRRLQRKPPNVLNAHTFLRETAAWPRYADLVKKTATIVAATQVAVDSREGRALEVLYALARSRPPSASDETKYILKVPLTPQQLALADAPESSKEWVFVDFGLPNATGAWLELMKPVVGRGPLVDDHIVGKRFAKGPDGKEVFAGNDLKRGFYAPWLWPPRVDGSIREATTGPPPELSEEDMRDFR